MAALGSFVGLLIFIGFLFYALVIYNQAAEYRKNQRNKNRFDR